MDIGSVIVRPIVTEKAMKEASLGRYTFRVLLEADKPTIRKAVEESFKVNVKAVETTIVKGKKRRVGRRRTHTTLSPWKKAIVRLSEGQKIDLFEELKP